MKITQESNIYIFYAHVMMLRCFLATSFCSCPGVNVNRDTLDCQNPDEPQNEFAFCFENTIFEMPLFNLDY